MFCLKKMKLLKSALKVCSRDVFGDMDDKIQQLTNSMNELDLANEVVGLQHMEVERRKMLLDDLWVILKNKERFKTKKKF